MKNSSEKPVVCITGVSRGIGLTCAQLFKEKGFIVSGCSRKENRDAKDVCDFFMPCDVSDELKVREWIQETHQKFSRLDVLINNAGVALGDSENNNIEEEKNIWDTTIKINLYGTFYATLAAKDFLPDALGRIINISSVLGLKGVPHHAAYCASKHGMIGFTKSMALNLAKRKITVNAICPGWTDTQMLEERIDAMDVDKDAIRATIPIGEITTPKQVAEIAYFLTQDAAATITGQAIVVDGGSII